MKCSSCNKDFKLTFQSTLYQELDHTDSASSAIKIINYKTMCLECFLRTNDIGKYIDMDNIPDEWFESPIREFDY